MSKYKLHPIAALVLAILLALVLVGTFVGLCIYCWKPWAWLLIPGTVGLVFFAAKPAIYLIKQLIAIFKGEE